MNEIKVAELFAGVGGFRLAFERANRESKADFKIVWSNQWEPGEKSQWASKVYCARFGNDGHRNENIEKVIDESFDEIPDFDLLVGGFPCQDYSVAKPKSASYGIKGKKGVLWWSIYRILERKGERRPSCVLLENVDRLLSSPSRQRGRDFAIILSSLSNLGYDVEWRVVDASEYGFPQRRKRTYVFGFRRDSEIGVDSITHSEWDWMMLNGILAKSFPCRAKNGGGLFQEIPCFELDGNLCRLSANFNKKNTSTPFANAGYVRNCVCHTISVEAIYDGKKTVLGDVVLPADEVPSKFWIDSEEELEKWRYLKGSKSFMRKSKDGFEYRYSEGAMAFPDNLGKPSRTIITGEGGSSPSRFKHVILQDGRYRRLCPVELERLDGFNDNHTLIPGISDTRRAFLLGNALVVGIIQKIALEINDRTRKD